MKKILIIEDEKDTIEVIYRFLEIEDEGYEVTSAEDGQSGLKQAHNIRPDLILLDIMLPDIDGIKVCRLLRSDKKFKFIPIIIITVLSEIDNIGEGLAAGANDYVTKPFDMPELLARIKSHLRVKELNELARREEEEKSKINLKKCKQTENAMRESEEKYKLFVQAMPDIVFTIDLAGKFVFISDFVESWGYKPEELIGKHFSELIHPDDVEAVSRFFVLRKYAGKKIGDENAPKLFDERRTRKRKTKDLEARFIRKNPEGVEKDLADTYGLITAFGEISSGGLYDDHSEEKKLIGTVGIIRDISELKRLEETSRQSQQHYEILINSTDGILWEADAKTFQFTFISKQAERLLGFPLENWLTEPTFWVSHLHPDDREWAVDFCLKATKDKRNHEFEYRMIAADGRIVWLRDLTTVVVENNQPAKLRGLIVDITAHKKAAEKQAKLYEQLKNTKQELENVNVELNEKVEELERFRDITIGREERIIELKNKLKELEKKLDEKKS